MPASACRVHRTISSPPDFSWVQISVSHIDGLFANDVDNDLAPRSKETQPTLTTLVIQRRAQYLKR